MATDKELQEQWLKKNEVKKLSSRVGQGFKYDL
jgi:hypothetical protein